MQGTQKASGPVDTLTTRTSSMDRAQIEESDRLVIRRGRIVDPRHKIDAVMDVFIAGGAIAALGEPPSSEWTADAEINADGCIVCPGLIDMSVHMREPGLEHKATIASETRAAAAGGVTTVCCPPDTDPVIDTPAVVELIRHRAAVAGYSRVFTLGALTQGLAGEHLSEMAALKTAGCCGVSNALRPLRNTQVERRAMEYAASFGLTVFLSAEDPWLKNGGCAHEGAVASRLGLPGIPLAAETAAVAKYLALIEQTGVRVHFCRLTTARSVQMVARAQYDGLPVTADVGIPYLFLTENDILDFDSQCHLDPPLRTQADRDALRAALSRGTLSALCSDHQPHEPDAKLAPFPDTAPGISGIETLLPLTLRLVDESVLTLNEAIERLTDGPARILELATRGLGGFAVGAPADITVFDLDSHWRVDSENLLSTGHNTPFGGWELRGRVMHTLVAGKQVYSLQ